VTGAAGAIACVRVGAAGNRASSIFLLIEAIWYFRGSAFLRLQRLRRLRSGEASK
jgi:hypothetical protein